MSAEPTSPFLSAAQIPSSQVGVNISHGLSVAAWVQQAGDME